MHRYEEGTQTYDKSMDKHDSLSNYLPAIVSPHKFNHILGDFQSRQQLSFHKPSTVALQSRNPSVSELPQFFYNQEEPENSLVTKTLSVPQEFLRRMEAIPETSNTNFLSNFINGSDTKDYDIKTFEAVLSTNKFETKNNENLAGPLLKSSSSNNLNQLPNFQQMKQIPQRSNRYKYQKLITCNTQQDSTQQYEQLKDFQLINDETSHSPSLSPSRRITETKSQIRNSKKNPTLASMDFLDDVRGSYNFTGRQARKDKPNMSSNIFPSQCAIQMNEVEGGKGIEKQLMWKLGENVNMLQPQQEILAKQRQGNVVRMKKRISDAASSSAIVNVGQSIQNKSTITRENSEIFGDSSNNIFSLKPANPPFQFSHSQRYSKSRNNLSSTGQPNIQNYRYISQKLEGMLDDKQSLQLQQSQQLQLSQTQQQQPSFIQSQQMQYQQQPQQLQPQTHQQLLTQSQSHPQLHIHQQPHQLSLQIKQQLMQPKKSFYQLQLQYSSMLGGLAVKTETQINSLLSPTLTVSSSTKTMKTESQMACFQSPPLTNLHQKMIKRKIKFMKHPSDYQLAERRNDSRFQKFNTQTFLD